MTTRTANRRVLDAIRTRGELDTERGTLVLWCEPGADEWKPGCGKLSRDLTALGVPHQITQTEPCHPPTWYFPGSKWPPMRWEQIWISSDGLRQLLRAIPPLRMVPGFGELPVP